MVRPRGHAGDAREPRRLARRNAVRDPAAATRTVTIRPVVRGNYIDPKFGKIYWTQKSDEGRLGVCAANIDLPKARAGESL